MKKMMIVLAALAMGFAASAASVTWTGSNIQPGPQTDVTKYMAYIIDNSAYALADVSKATLNDAIGAASASVAVAKTSSTATTGKIAGTSFTDSYVTGDKPNYYLVVLDGPAGSAQNFFVSTLKSGTVTQMGGLSLAFGSLSAASGAGKWTAAPSGDTPEPTSGLLLLVGGAMLALRRRRA